MKYNLKGLEKERKLTKVFVEQPRLHWVCYKQIEDSWFFLLVSTFYTFRCGFGRCCCLPSYYHSWSVELPSWLTSLQSTTTLPGSLYNVLNVVFSSDCKLYHFSELETARAGFYGRRKFFVTGAAAAAFTLVEKDEQRPAPHSVILRAVRPYSEIV